MRAFLLIILLALIGAGVYGYSNNPAVCRKLGTEAVTDLTTIFTPGSGTNSNAGSPESEKSDSATTAGATSATDAQPKHWKQGFVTEPDAAASAPVPVPEPQAMDAAPVAQAPLAYQDSDFNDYDQALAASRTRHRPMVILFTGSDWCPYCQSLEHEVLSTGQFEKYKDSHFVFLTVDDLRSTTVMDDEKARINSLEHRFSIHEFPTLVVVGTDEKELGRTSGYTPGSGVSGVEDDLNKFLKN